MSQVINPVVDVFAVFVEVTRTHTQIASRCGEKIHRNEEAVGRERHGDRSLGSRRRGGGR